MSTEAAAPRVLTAAETWSLVVIETATIVLHFLFGMMFCKEFLQGMLLSVTQRDTLPAPLIVLVHVVSNVAILYWIVYRLSHDVIDMSTKEIAFRFGLKRFAPGKVFASVCLLHCAGFALISVLQQSQHGHTLFSLDNFHDFNGNIDWIRSIDMILISPLREEVVFRAAMFTTILRRIPLRPVRSIVIANVVFGAIHLANLYGSRFSAEYISLQIVMGVLVGAFYSTRFFLSQSLWEPLVMHLINNVLSSLLPLHFELEISNYSVIVPLIISFLAYNILLVCDIWQIASLPQFNYPFPLIAPAHAAIEAEAEAGNKKQK